MKFNNCNTDMESCISQYEFSKNSLAVHAEQALHLFEMYLSRRRIYHISYWKTAPFTIIHKITMTWHILRKWDFKRNLWPGVWIVYIIMHHLHYLESITYKKHTTYNPLALFDTSWYVNIDPPCPFSSQQTPRNFGNMFLLQLQKNCPF